MRPEFLWEEAVEIEAGRTCDQTFKLYKANRKPAAIPSNAVIRFKLCSDPADDTPLLDIDSVAALAGGSVVTIVADGTDDVTPAEVRVRFGQADTIDLDEGDDYFGEIGVVDPTETDPVNAFKRAGYGPVRILPSPGGDVGLA